MEPAGRGEIPIINEYAKGEKGGIFDYQHSEQPFLLDLEVAFARKRSAGELQGKAKSRENVADRIDMARLVLEGDTLVLKLVEVKLDNNKDLRSESEPRIMGQMSRYKQFIETQGDAILDAYKTVADTYQRLGICRQMPILNGLQADAVLKMFKEHGLLDPKPYLLILGSQESLLGKKDHWRCLCERFDAIGYPVPEIWGSRGKVDG